MVHACIGTDEAVTRFDDEDAVRAYDAPRFAEDHFDKARIAREFFCQS